MFLFRSLFLLVLFLSSGPLHAQMAAENKNVDPFESINRAMFALNNELYNYALRPAVETYQFIMPDVAERSVHNFFANLVDVNAIFNSILQGRLDKAAITSGRFLVNTTFGIAGFVDVATAMGIERYRTDFGYTLALWGVQPGPYLMVPLFGPHTLRSGTGVVVDIYSSPPTYLDDVAWRNSLYALSLVEGRSGLIQAEQLLSGDRYLFVRDAYLQQRDAFVNDGVVEDNFSNFDQDDDWGDEL